MSRTITIETHRVVAVIGDRARPADYEYLLVGDGHDWATAQSIWQIIDDARRAGEVPGLVFAAVRSDDRCEDERMRTATLLPYYWDAPDGGALTDPERINAYIGEKENLRAEAEKEQKRVARALARAARPPRLQRTTIAGVVFEGGAGRWTTLDGRFSIEDSEFLTECQCVVRDIGGRCRHWEDGVRYYNAWIVWDNTINDYLFRSPDPMESRAQAAQAVADQYASEG